MQIGHRHRERVAFSGAALTLATSIAAGPALGATLPDLAVLAGGKLAALPSLWGNETFVRVCFGLALCLLGAVLAWRYVGILRLNRRLVAAVEAREQAIRALRDSESRFGDLIEHSNLAMQVTTRDGPRVLVNRAYAALAGYDSPEELKAAPPRVFVAPRDRARTKRDSAAIFDGGGPTTYEFDAIRKDGTVFPVQAFVQRVSWHGKDAIQRTFIDLTERKRAERALSESEARYRGLIEQAPLGISIYAQDGRRLFANDALATLVGYRSASELLTAPIGTLVPSEDVGWIRKRLAAAFDGGRRGSDAHEMRLVHKNGTLIPVDSFVRRIVWAGEDAVERTFVDLSERKRAEASLRESEDRFRSVFESGGAGMVLCDSTGKYLQVNKAFCDFVGYPAEELVGRSTRDLTHPEDIAEGAAALAAIERGERRRNMREKRYVRKDGETVWGIVCAVGARSAVTGTPYVIGIIQDITERKRVEQALAESHEQLMNAQRIGHMGGWTRDFATGRLIWSDEIYRIFGVSREDREITFERYLAEIVHPEDRQRVTDAVRAVLSSGALYSLDHRVVRADGEIRVVHEEAEVTFAPGGTPLRFVGTAQDITELARAHQALETSEARFRGVFEAGGVAIVVNDERGRIHEFNRSFADLLGYGEHELANGRIQDLIHPEDASLAARQRHALLTGELQRYAIGRRFIRKDGAVVWADVNATLMQGAGERTPMLVGIVQDITQRKRSEDDLAQKTALLDLVRDLATAANHAAGFADAVRIYLNRICAFTGWPVGHAFVRAEDDPDVLRPMLVWHLGDPERFRPYVEATGKMVLRVGVGAPGLVIEHGDIEWRTHIPINPDRPTSRTAAGQAVGFKSAFAAPVMVGTRIVAVLEFYATEVIPRDERVVEAVRQAGTELGRVYEREQTERMLRRREQQLRQIIDNVPHWIYVKDRDGKFLLVNKATADAYGRSIDEVVGRTQRELYGDADEAARILAHDRAVIASGQMTTSPNGRFIRRDGSVRNLRITKMPYASEPGEVAVLGIADDVTEHLRAEEERRRAQRMDALGKMTGGVAHDFNNLLTIILGNLQLLERRIRDESLHTLVTTAERAARRGADVTRRLLAFARSQPLEPRPIDLNELVRDMTALVERSLGSGIAIETRPANGLWQTMADPGQVENALLNLVLNARDAMPQGGRLVIATANIRVTQRSRRRGDLAIGAYASVSVADSGIGMAEDVKARAVEPFFTTKEMGRGNGLGLSMVYGFVRQSGGDIAIESEPGKGTTVRLYLPRGPKAAAERPTAEATMPGGSRETVLVVDDDPDVRAFARTVLEGLDYRVVEVEDAAAALTAADRSETIDVLFTDLKLPAGMDGGALAQAIRQRRPGVAVIFTSGDLDGPASDPAAAFLHKPYTSRDLASALHSVLDRRRPRKSRQKAERR